MWCRGDVGGDSHRRRRNIDDDAGNGGKSAKQGGRLGAVVVKSVEGSLKPRINLYKVDTR
ncbi:hypothetical protein HanXRQr2_Chr05g0200011 [Helianthus annuus]|nr:hypothetical protein HanXRQr2_Chr05g0200011 [Helianthus annuus]KAJ0921550.1 hypothetical protein HanPSC8_Chr05g0192861 [Helianthus annuus]